METLSPKQFGSLTKARNAFAAYLAGSSVYKKFIEDRLPGENLENIAWEKIPELTKSAFYAQYPWEAIIPRENYRDIYSVQRSSGSTNKDGSSKGFFWPKLRSHDLEAAPLLQQQIVDSFKLKERSTLMIIGLSLGSWAGGEEFSFIFKSLTLMNALPLVVFSPGNQHLEILEIIEKAGSAFDQIMIALCPSAIFYLERLAEQKKIPLPMEKICFLVTGEPFPEDFRLDLQRRCGQLLSVYGSADTGIIGFESVGLVLLRQYLTKHPSLARELGFSSHSIPNLYHVHLGDAYFEEVNEELLVTKWQGIPLIRYNLKDRVRFFSWSALCDRLAKHDTSSTAPWKTLEAMPAPDVLSVSGRTEGCVFLCGSNIYESMIQEIVLQSSISAKITGAFVGWVEMSHGQQVLHLQFELKARKTPPAATEKTDLYQEFVALLSKQQPEFGDDYEKLYKPFESAGQHVMHFHFVQEPHLSQHAQYAASVKRKIFIDKGPL